MHLPKEESHIIDEARRCAKRKYSWSEYVREFDNCLKSMLFYLKRSNK